MAKKMYYLLYLDQNGVVHPWNQVYSDITEIDMLTLDYQKEGFLRRFFPSTSIKDLFIGRLTYHQKEEAFTFHFYECFFQKSPVTAVNSKIYESMKRFALERNQKTKGTGKIELGMENPLFQDYCNFLVEHLTSHQEILYRFCSDKNITNPHLKKSLLLYSKQNQSLRLSLFSLFKKYKELRMVSLVYDSFSHEPIHCEKMNAMRENYLYSSTLFGFYYDFPLYYQEAGKIKEKDYIPPDYLQKYRKIQEIIHSDFDSEEIQTLYQIGGSSYVLEHMDTNALYNSSKNDLLRLGLIDANLYFSSSHKNRK